MSAAAGRASAPQAAAETDFEWPSDAIEVGRIIDAWGIKGALKVVPFSKDPQALFSSRRWYLQPPDNAAGPGGRLACRLLKIIQAREQGDVIVATAQDVADRTAAEALRQWRIFVPRGSFPSSAPDEFYWVDLIGLDVVNREGVVLGQVIDLMDTGAHSVLQVAHSAQAPATERRLIPFVAAYVDEVRLTERRILVDWGLDF